MTTSIQLAAAEALRALADHEEPMLGSADEPPVITYDPDVLYESEVEEYLGSLFEDEVPIDDDGDWILDPWFAAFVRDALVLLASCGTLELARSRVAPHPEATARRWLAESIAQGPISESLRAPCGQTLGQWAQQLQREERISMLQCVHAYLEDAAGDSVHAETPGAGNPDENRTAPIREYMDHCRYVLTVRRGEERRVAEDLQARQHEIEAACARHPRRGGGDERGVRIVAIEVSPRAVVLLITPGDPSIDAVSDAVRRALPPLGKGVPYWG